MKSEVSQADIIKVKNYMYKYHCGHNNRTWRHTIAKTLNMPDRHFRKVCSFISEIITSSKQGYYILPLTDFTGEETKIAVELLKEERKKIISLYRRGKGQRKAISKMAMSKKEEQLVWPDKPGITESVLLGGGDNER